VLAAACGRVAEAIVIHSCNKFYTEYAMAIVLAACGRGAKQYATDIVLLGTTGNTLRTTSRRPAAALASVIVIHSCDKHYTEYATHIVIHSCDKHYTEYASHIVIHSCNKFYTEYATAIVLAAACGRVGHSNRDTLV